MFYQYSLKVEVVLPIEESEMDYEFKINIRKKMPFVLGNCYVTVYKNHQKGFIYSDTLKITYYSDKNNIANVANGEIKKTIDLITFLTQIPFESAANTKAKECDAKPTINIDDSRIKMNKMSSINARYLDNKHKRKEFEQSLRQFSLAVRLNYFGEYIAYDDAFLACFKIIETISNTTYEENKKIFAADNNMVQNFIVKYLKYKYKIMASRTKNESLIKELDAMFAKKIKNELYYRILICTQFYKIKIDAKKLETMVKLRNDIAHGKSVNGEDTYKSFFYAYEISRSLLAKKYFQTSIKKLELPCTIKSHLIESL